MRLPEAIKILQQNTMACWWPNGSWPGQQEIDKEGIIGEARLLLEGIRQRQDIPDNALFFTLDEANPETWLYDKIVESMQVFSNSIGV